MDTERFEITTFEPHNGFSRAAKGSIHTGLTWQDLATRLDKAHVNQLNTNWDLGQGRVVSYRDEHNSFCQVRRYFKD